MPHNSVTDCAHCGRGTNSHIVVSYFGQGPGAYPHLRFCSAVHLRDFFTYKLGGGDDTPLGEQVRRFDLEQKKRFDKQATS